MKTVPLHGRTAAGRVALVDDEDFDLVMQYRWNVWEKPERDAKRANGPYATTKVPVGGGRYATLRMHVLIMGIKGVDHEDHDGLNNQRYNLRPANQSQNAGNQRPQIGRSSSYKGVSWVKESRKWRARIRVNGQSRFIGDFKSELAAARAYDAAARETFGRFAYANFPEGCEPVPQADGMLF